MTDPPGTPRLTTFHPASDQGSCAEVVANVAWMLAAAGRSVLVLEWLPPRADDVGRHLRLCPHRRFVDRRPVLDPATHRIVERTFSGPSSPGTSGPGRWAEYPVGDRGGVLVVASFGPGSGEADPPRLREVTGLAERLAEGAAGPEHVLLHGHPVAEQPAGAGSAAVLQTGEDEDTRLAVGTVRAIGRRSDRVDVVPVLVGSRTSGITLWGEYGQYTAPTSVYQCGPVEVPYVPNRPSGPVLAALADRDGAAAGAYHELALRLSGADPSALPPLPAAWRDRYRWALHEEPADVPVYRLRYAPPDRPWADLVAEWLRRAGVRTARLPADEPPDERVVTVRSAHTAPPTDRPDASFTVRVDGASGTGGPEPGAGLDLAALPEPDRAPALLAALGLFGPAPPPSGVAPRTPVPTDTVQAGDPPLRDPCFTGRDDDAEAIRDVVAPLDGGGPPAASTVYLTGPSGVGRTALAMEYLYRFRDSYGGRVCWLSAADPETLRAGLAGFARRMNLSRPPDARAALQAFADAGAQGRRWLVVLHDASVEALDSLPGLERFDALVTTSEPPGHLPPGTVVRVGELGPEERRELVRALSRSAGPTGDGPPLGEEEVERITKLVGGFPLPLVMATRWLHGRHRTTRRVPPPPRPGGPEPGPRPVPPAVEALRRDSVDLLAERLANVGGDVLVPLVDLVCSTLGGSSDAVDRLAGHLASICAFLAPDGIALDIVRSRPFVRRLATLAGPDGRDLRADDADIDRVLVAGARLGLYDVDWHRPAALRMNATVQSATRAALPRPRRVRARATALAALADLVPFDADEAGARDRMVELQRHVVPAGVATAADPGEGLEVHLGSAFTPGTDGWAVRCWLVEHVGFTYLAGTRPSHPAALALAESVVRHWTELLAALPDADPADDRPLQRLRDRRGALLMATNRPAEALAVDERLLADLRRHLGGHHPRSLHAAGAVAGDLRRLGHFEEAYTEDLVIRRTVVDTLGRDHPESQAAGNNLAISMLLAGRFADALALQDELHRARSAVLGADNPWTRRSLRRLGTYRWACGDHAGAHADLHRLLGGAQEPAADEHETLLVRFVLGAVERLLPAAPPGLALRDAEALHAELAELLGPDHPHTAAARLEIAIAAFRAGGADRAVVEARGCRDDLAEQFRQRADAARRHPYLSLVDTCLAVFLRARGDRDAALDLGREALIQLTAQVGKRHPWRLSAALNHAHALAAPDGTGPAEAGALLDSVRRSVATQRLFPAHPLVRGTAPDVRAGTAEAADALTPGIPVL